MFRAIADFEKAWSYETDATLKVLRALTDISLAQAVGPEGRTLGRLAWHLVLTIPEMAGQTGLVVPGPPLDAPPPAHAADIATAYQTTAAALRTQLSAQWNDAGLLVEDEMYGERWARGYTIFALLVHQTHHRGQMTVLMRQAGLPVPGVYGPAREEWASMGMQPPAV